MTDIIVFNIVNSMSIFRVAQDETFLWFRLKLTYGYKTFSLWANVTILVILKIWPFAESVTFLKSNLSCKQTLLQSNVPSYQVLHFQLQTETYSASMTLMNEMVSPAMAAIEPLVRKLATVLSHHLLMKFVKLTERH